MVCFVLILILILFVIVLLLFLFLFSLACFCMYNLDLKIELGEGGLRDLKGKREGREKKKNLEDVVEDKPILIFLEEGENCRGVNKKAKRGERKGEEGRTLRKHHGVVCGGDLEDIGKKNERRGEKREGRRGVMKSGEMGYG